MKVKYFFILTNLFYKKIDKKKYQSKKMKIIRKLKRRKKLIKEVGRRDKKTKRIYKAKTVFHKAFNFTLISSEY